MKHTEYRQGTKYRTRIIDSRDMVVFEGMGVTEEETRTVIHRFNTYNALVEALELGQKLISAAIEQDVLGDSHFGVGFARQAIDNALALARKGGDNG